MTLTLLIMAHSHSEVASCRERCIAGCSSPVQWPSSQIKRAALRALTRVGAGRRVAWRSANPEQIMAHSHSEVASCRERCIAGCSSPVQWPSSQIKRAALRALTRVGAGRRVAWRSANPEQFGSCTAEPRTCSASERPKSETFAVAAPLSSAAATSGGFRVVPCAFTCTGLHA
jgi:surface antigen